MIESTIHTRPKVLCFIDYYLPGLRAGGPIRTIQNLVSQLNEEFDFYIVTRAHDFLEKTPYENIIINQWNNFENSKVFYASNSMLSARGIINLLDKTPHDILYLNSFFSSVMTFTPLVIRYFKKNYNKPVILAPRGEFSEGALQLKKYKKRIYIIFANKLRGIYRNLIWQASSSNELIDIKRTLTNVAFDSNIIIAPDLLPLFESSKINSNKLISRTANQLRIIFLSRICPIKNLDYLIKALIKVNVTVSLTIYGPVEDLEYWLYCKKLIKNLPKNVLVSYKGMVPHNEVLKVFSEHDFFILPTRGENFGHVIHESLISGTAVIISDKTPWKEDKQGAVIVIPLDKINEWTAKINEIGALSDEKLINLRIAAKSYILNYLQNNSSKNDNRFLFQSALEKNFY